MLLWWTPTNISTHGLSHATLRAISEQMTTHLLNLCSTITQTPCTDAAHTCTQVYVGIRHTCKLLKVFHQGWWLLVMIHSASASTNWFPKYFRGEHNHLFRPRNKTTHIFHTTLYPFRPVGTPCLHRGPCWYNLFHDVKVSKWLLTTK